MTASALQWVRRSEPLVPVAVTATPGSEGALREATIRRLRSGASLRVVAHSGTLVVLGASDDLPWASSAIYLGWDAGVLVPTKRTPTTPVEILAPTLRVLLPEGHDLVVLLPWAILVSPTPVRRGDPVALGGAAQ
jgi:hypothetical protein